jgi:hypothetical protein
MYAQAASKLKSDAYGHMMKNTIIAIPSFILIFLAVMSLPAQAMDTLSCASDAYEIQIHVNSENTVADLILYTEKAHIFRKEDLELIRK